MAKDTDHEDFHDNPAIINHYNLLNDLGVLDHIQYLNDMIRSRDDLMEQAIEIFNSPGIEDLVNFLISKFLNKFIPSKLIVILQSELEADTATTLCFENMQPSECQLNIEALRPYKEYFRLSPRTTTFRVFEYLIDDKKMTDIFLPLEPEIVVPMMGLDGMYGFMIFGKKVINKQYTDQETEYIDTLLRFASISLQNIIHHKRAIYDSKTHLYNHAYFSLRLHEEFHRLKRYESKISILILDLDHFKKLNDTYGHMVGDKVLTHVADLIKKSLRAGDIPARFGGEEFVVMLMECSVADACVVAERIRALIAETPLINDNQEIHTSVSIGISQGSRESCKSTEELIEQADIALYRSKLDGRNRYTVFQPGMVAESS